MIEVIHCHIPKTGGVSFLQIIEEIYGKEAIAFPWTWLGMAPEEGKGFDLMWHDWPKLKRIWKTNVPRIVRGNNKLRVLQGHHPVSLYYDMFPHARRICWVRNPIQRVISNYYHDMKNGHQPNMSIEKYIHLPENQNVVSFHMGHNIDNFDFIGVVEFMEKDLEVLATLLKWKYIPDVPRLNVGIYPRDTSQGVMDMIREFNYRDVAIYQAVLERRP